MAESGFQDAERREAFYSGRVQGVGFRYTVCRLADRFRVAGFVRNLPDGRVQLVAEGNAADLSAFMDAIADGMAGFIADVDIDVGPGSNEYSTFEVRY